MAQVMLESFEQDMPVSEEATLGFEQGYAEGILAGREAVLAEQDILSRELVQQLADLEFKYNEVRGEIIGSLGPLFSILSDKVLPQLLSDSFAQRIVTLLLDAAARGQATGNSLCVHPSQEAAIAAAIMDADIEVTLSTDAGLTENAVRLIHSSGALQVDGDQLIADIRDILSSADFIETGNELHG